MPEVIRLDNVSKKFIIHREKHRSFQDVFVSRFRNNGSREEFWALDNVSFSVRKGETVGIIGQNGSGKSTILKLMSRIIEPTTGKITVNGTMSALLELGAGFHPDLTGRDNVFLNGSLLGFSRRDMQRKFEDIVAFSELEQFIDTPVKHYSSGMYMRLAFAIAINVDPDILLVDEVLAVGDQSFQEKCLDKIREFQSAGKTIIFVSHALETVKSICNRAIWLDHGRIRARGESRKVVMEYLRQVEGFQELPPSEERQAQERQAIEQQAKEQQAKEQQAKEQQAKERQAKERQAKERQAIGQQVDVGLPEAGQDVGTIRILDVRILGIDGGERQVLHTGDDLVVRLQYAVCDDRPPQDCTFAVSIADANGALIHRALFPTKADQIRHDGRCGALELTYSSLPLLEGIYNVSAAVWPTTSPDSPFDVYRQKCRFSIEGRRAAEDVPEDGIVSLRHAWCRCNGASASATGLGGAPAERLATSAKGPSE